MSQKEHQRRVLARFLDTLNGTWRGQAACDPATGIIPADRIPRFFGADAADPDTDLSLEEQRQAAFFCHNACPVQAECLAYALNVGEHAGVWGGTTETERRLLHRGYRSRRQPA